MSFTSKDLEQITNMKLILPFTGKVGFTRNKWSEAFRLNISNTQLIDWLLSIGLTPHKSLTLGPLKIPDEYFIDFLRGHLDGDGCITTYIDKYNTKKKSSYVYQRIFTTFISASKSHIDWLHGKIVELTEIRGAVHITKVKDLSKNPMHIIKFAKKDSLKLLAKIYYSDNIPCLSRKRLTYTNFLKNSSVEQ
ncbi:MAG: hypothetical protein KBC33_03515 [Candidatus Pacebacteria bacterium]|nr:hypothetical protein [Candidatus Paceibacterota bacterium]